MMLGFTGYLRSTYRMFQNGMWEHFHPLVTLPKVKSIHESISSVALHRKSLSRFGDGEFKLMCGSSLKFQDYEEELANRLRKIIRSEVDGLALGIPGYFGPIPSEKKKIKQGVRSFVVQYRSRVYNLVDLDKVYYNTLLSQYYAFNPHSDMIEDYFKQLRSLWAKENIYLVKGKNSELDSENSIYGNAESIVEYLAPSRNAFSQYPKLLEDILFHHDGRLVILALGPTATVLAYDLHMLGVRALDLGHLNKAYDWFCRKKVVGESAESFFPV